MVMKMVAPLEIGICVDNLDGMIAFSRDVIGLEYVSTFDVPPDKSAQASFTDRGYRIVRLQTNSGERIKLARPLDAPAAPAEADEILARRGNVFLTFIVADLDAQIDQLVAAGVKMRTGKKRIVVRDGVYLAFAEDPEGNYLEFVEYADIAAYRPDSVPRG